MHNRLERIIGVVLLLSLSGATWAATFSDNFDTPRDYLKDGTAGTGWDGFMGLGPNQTASAINASVGRPGALFLESANSWWEGAFSPVGPFLYKNVAGDFVATVEVTDFPGLPGSALARTANADSFLMARVANLEDAGAGEDFVATHYFPTWSGNIRRNYNGTTEQEQGATGNGFSCARWLQLERTGNVFTFRISFDGVTWTLLGGDNGTITRADMDGLPVQVGLAQCMYATVTGYVAFDNFSVTGPLVVPPNKAFNPVPSGNDVPRDTDLSWSPNATATAHDVYFGTSLADVTAADRTNSLNVLVSQGQTATTFEPGRFTFGQTYYWRIDEVEGGGATINRGEVWSFTAEPVSYPITGVTATASSSDKTTTGPEKTVNGSGLDPATDQHGTIADDGWVSGSGAPQWIQYELPQAYKLDKMLVWNSNQTMESAIGFGARNVAIDVSLDGVAWTPLGAFEFARAPGTPGYVANTSVDLAGSVAKFVKLTISSNWGGLLPRYGLSEVRFYSIPVLAREPKPATGSTNLNPQVAMSWRPGREAGSHDLYLGADPNAVRDGAVAPITIAQPAYDFAANLGSTYYWKVVEVNQAETPTSWGTDPVWSFSTATTIAVDDFEGYTDLSPNRVFQTWIDGAGFSADEFFPNGGASNGTGSFAGHDPAAGNIMETEIVYAGRQSMPLYYDNSAAPKISEAKRTFVEPQDWSKHGVTTLLLWVFGQASNSPAAVYVKINDFKVVDQTISTTKAMWQQFPITLASVPSATLKSVKSLTIGVGDGAAGGSGMIVVDDLRLYAVAPAKPVLADPGTNGLVALYAMEGNLNDTVGNKNGTALGEPGYVDSMAGFGKALAFDGVNDAADLPIGSLIGSLSSATFSVWVDIQNTGNLWQRIFDFGITPTSGNPNTYMFLTAYNGSSAVRFAMRTASVGERLASAPRALPSGWHHIALVIDSATMTMQLYEDGTQVATNSNTLTILPKDLGTTTYNYLGDSGYPGDPYFTGSLDDFKIFNRALSAGEVRYLAGDR